MAYDCMPSEGGLPYLLQGRGITAIWTCQCGDYLRSPLLPGKVLYRVTHLSDSHSTWFAPNSET